jgi:hypothetical protein
VGKFIVADLACNVARVVCGYGENAYGPLRTQEVTLDFNIKQPVSGRRLRMFGGPHFAGRPIGKRGCEWNLETKQRDTSPAMMGVVDVFPELDRAMPFRYI